MKVNYCPRSPEHDNWWGAKYCGICGAVLKAFNKYCDVCGFPADAMDQYCTICSNTKFTQLTEDARGAVSRLRYSTSIPEDVEEPLKPQKSRRRWRQIIEKVQSWLRPV